MRKKRHRRGSNRSWFQAQIHEGLSAYEAAGTDAIEEDEGRDCADDAAGSMCLPQSPGQAQYLAHLESPAYATVVCSGPAGTGKTLFACQVGMHQLLCGQVRRLILTRPTITANENHGFLPGTLDNKMHPWMCPLMDIFEGIVGKEELQNLRRGGYIEVCPLAYMRGRTFANAWIVADEMQNATVDQMMMMLTRIGRRSKLCITGDARQSDLQLRGNRPNGLVDLLRRLRIATADGGKPLAHIVHARLQARDIQRAPAVEEILTRLYSEGGGGGGSAAAEGGGGGSAAAEGGCPLAT